MSSDMGRSKLAKIIRARLDYLSNDFPKGRRAVLQMEAEAIEGVINDWPRTALASDYKVAKLDDGRHVIMLRKFNVVVAEFAENTAACVDFFTDILGT